MTFLNAIAAPRLRSAIREWARPPRQPDIDPRVESLWLLPVPEFSVATLRGWTEQTLRARLSGDEFLDNMILNKWEFAHGKTVLKSYPWRLSVPFIMCNAKCDFCAAWLIKGNVPLNDLMTALVPVIRRCWHLDLVGWGEPLIHPQFADVLELIRREADPRARLALTTNGTRLEAWVDRLLAANVQHYAISIHAANAKTHQDLMGFGPEVFDRVLDGVRKLTAMKAQFPQILVELVLLVTQQNIAEIPAFIEMASRLGADGVHLRTLMPMESPRDGLDYHRLPPYLHPHFELLRDAAIAAIAQAPIAVRAEPETWSRPVFSPEWEPRLAAMPTTSREERKDKYSLKLWEHDWPALGAGERSRDETPCHAGENVYGRGAPLYCPSPYTAFYINSTDRRVIPCVYMHKVPDHEFIHLKPSMTFDEAWNSPAMVAVRRSLHHGPLMPTCLKCPFHC